MTQNKFKFFAIMILSITLSLFYSCSTPSYINSEKKSIGKNFIAKTDVPADMFFFKDRIHNFYLDSTTNTLTIQLRGINSNGRYLDNHGRIVLFDISSQKEKWSKAINYQSEELYQNNNSIILTNGTKCYALNDQTGEKNWSLKNDLMFTDFKKKIGFGYKSGDEINHRLQGVDLNTGKPIWMRELQTECGWNGLLPLNDSTVIVATDGLHSINLKTGLGWNYLAVTGKKENIDHTAENVGGVALGLLTGMYVISYGGANITHGIASNIMIDSIGIYWAAKQKIVKLSHSGQVLWEYGLPQGMASKSEILLKDSIVYMINYGYAYLNNRLIDFGQPFVAGFNNISGHKAFLYEFKEKNQIINDFHINNHDMLTISNSQISKISIMDSKMLSQKTINTDSLGYLRRFVSKKIYIKRDSTFKTLQDIDSTNTYIITGKSKLIGINDRLEVVKQFDHLTPYTLYLEKDGYKFIGSSTETYVLDKNNKVVANIKITNNAELIGTKLYDCANNTMIIIDLKDIINL